MIERTSDSWLRDLEEAFRRFRIRVDALPEAWFLERMNGWSPRDVVAHCVGWNRYTIQGTQEILRGVPIFYLEDEANDFSTVNQVSVERYSAVARDRLLSELDASFGELGAFLRRLSASQWDHDFGVRHRGYILTVENNVDGLRQDYDKHRETIETWVANKRNQTR